ncbi:MAG: hypothetical protein K2K23_00570, partial [Muribaculaceae bacterium]|nr:hypothetical protein [Muribaculaceae bacterium]
MEFGLYLNWYPVLIIKGLQDINRLLSADGSYIDAMRIDSVANKSFTYVLTGIEHKNSGKSEIISLKALLIFSFLESEDSPNVSVLACKHIEMISLSLYLDSMVSISRLTAVASFS